MSNPGIPRGYLICIATEAAYKEAIRTADRPFTFFEKLRHDQHNVEFQLLSKLEELFMPELHFPGFNYFSPDSIYWKWEGSNPYG